MNKKTRRLIILIGIFLLLLLILSGIRTWNQKQEEKRTEEFESEKIYATDLADVCKISYSIGNGELTFEKQNDAWVYEQDKDFPLKQGVLKRIADTFGKLELER